MSEETKGAEHNVLTLEAERAPITMVTVYTEQVAEVRPHTAWIERSWTHQLKGSFSDRSCAKLSWIHSYPWAAPWSSFYRACL
jgi:hypothetical protein